MEVIKELKRGGLLMLEPGRATAVRVVEGSVWLTQHRDSADYVMRAGEGMALSRVGTTMIHAFEDSSLRFFPPEDTRAPRKLGPRLNGPIAASV